MSATLTPMEREVLRVSFARMFRPGHYFDICVVDNAAKLCGVEIPARTHATLRALHCVHWSEISPALKQDIAETVAELFAIPAVAAVEEAQQAKPPRGFIARLISGGAA